MGQSMVLVFVVSFIAGVEIELYCGLCLVPFWPSRNSCPWDNLASVYYTSQ